MLAAAGLAADMADATIINIVVLHSAAVVELDIELAVPVAAPFTAGGRVRPGVLPACRYAVLRHTGPTMVRVGHEQALSGSQVL